MIVGRKISVQAVTALLAVFAAVVLLAAMPSPAAAAPSYAWATKGGGTGDVIADDVSALPDGSSIITGYFSGTATFGATSLTSAGLADTFTAKMNADGTYAWATRGGGAGNDYGYGVSALPDGASIITGAFNGTATFGATTLTSDAGSDDTFTAKMNADGTYAWATRGGGTGYDSAYDVSALPDGASIITGVFRGTATFGATSLTSDGPDDIFTAKVNADGTYAWATKGGGTGDDQAISVSALPDGSSIITGYFINGTATFGSTILISAGLLDTFTAKVNANGTYAWATRGGGTGNDSAYDVSALPDGASIITGAFNGTATFGATSLTSAGLDDTFTAKVNADGTYAWATRGGGTGGEYAWGVSALPDGSSIITGSFDGTATFGATTFTSGGGTDTFTTKVNADGTYAWATKGGGSGTDIAYGVSALPDGSSIITGSFDGTATFGATSLISAGVADTFTARILADAPQAPTGASASAGIQEATITWNAVAGGSVSSYTATAAPGGASCTAVAPAITCTISNLTPGASYTATVTATNQKGTSPPSRASNAVTPTDVALALAPTAPVNTFTMKRSKIWPQKINTQLNLPGPGKVAQAGTTRRSTPRRSSEMAKKKARTMTVCTARKSVATAGTVTITCRLNAKARAARKTHALTVRLVTTFTPTGGTAKSLSTTLVLKQTR